MILLLDTHAFIWMATGSPLLPDRARVAIANPENRGLLSAASAWEIATKHRLGRLEEATSILPSYSNVRELLELINAILDISKVESGTERLNETTVAISDIVRSSLVAVRSQADRMQISLEQRIRNDLPRWGKLIRASGIKAE